MHCPYCHGPLEALVLGERKTGAYQCVKCQGTWLSQAELGALASGERSTSLVPHISGQASALPGPWEGGGMSASYPTSRSPWPSGSSGPEPGRSGARRPQTAAGGTTANKQGWWSKPSPPLPLIHPDWNVCTYCGKPGPGSGATCQHCNVERMCCPQCQRLMVGVRRHSILVDMCITCHALWFERGRLEALLRALYTDASTPDGQQEAPHRSPSLLQQLAAFLEQTDRGVLAESSRAEIGLWSAIGSSFREGVGGGRQILYDLLTLLGELESPDGKNPGKR